MTMNANPTDDSSVDLYWLPLGAGEAYPTVRLVGPACSRRSSPAGTAATPPGVLFHSALEVPRPRGRAVRHRDGTGPGALTAPERTRSCAKVLWGFCMARTGVQVLPLRGPSMGQTASSRTGLPCSWVVRSA